MEDGTGGQSKLCNALSAIEYQFLYSVQSLCQAEVDLSVDERAGFFKLHILKFDETKTDVLGTLCSSLTIGITMLVENFPEYISFKKLNS